MLAFTSSSLRFLSNIAFADLIIAKPIDKILRMNTLKLFINYYDFYELLKELVDVFIFLLSEMMFLVITIATVWQLETIYHRLKNTKNA